MIIDIHTHCFPDDLAARALAKLQKSGGLAVFHDGTAAGLARETRLAGIDLAIVQPIATKPEQTLTINRWALDLGDPVLMGFGTLHPEFAGWRDEIRWLKAQGCRGIKMHPEYQDFFVDDERHYPIYEALFQAGLILLFHAGVDIAYRGPYHCTPERLAHVIEAFPDNRIIAAHMGGFRFWDDVEKYLVGRPIYLDTSFGMPELGSQRMLELMRAHGLDRILFGSDAPWASQAAALADMRNLGLTAAELEAVLGGNAMRLLNLVPC